MSEITTTETEQKYKHLVDLLQSVHAWVKFLAAPNESPPKPFADILVATGGCAASVADELGLKGVGHEQARSIVRTWINAFAWLRHDTGLPTSPCADAFASVMDDPASRRIWEGEPGERVFPFLPNQYAVEEFFKRMPNNLASACCALHLYTGVFADL